MSKKMPKDMSPRITNRKALHDYFIESKIECGMMLVGTEVKSLRLGMAQLHDAYAAVEGSQLILHQCHIDPYKHAAIVYSHEPKRDRRLLVHKREITKLKSALAERGTTLIPLAIYFSKGVAKIELGIAKGKQKGDKRESIKRKEQDRDMRRAMTHRQ